jgi:choline dehydrogenase
LPGWDYAHVLPYFKRSERHADGGNAYHGASGPLEVFAPELSSTPLAAAFVQAAVESGYGPSVDVNGERQEGFGRIDRTTTNKGRRASAARTYLAAALARPNLTVLTGALVRRLMIEAGRAVGVEYSVGPRLARASADAEVIVSAGAINSPQLLQLSGVGDPKHLSSVGIAPCLELSAVGTHLNDHPDIVIQHRCAQPVSIYPANRGLGKVFAGLRWFAGLDGPANSNHFEAGGFIRSRPGIEYPDLQLTFMPLAIKPGTVDDVGMHSFQVHIDLMRPKSLGSVLARSADPAAAPSIRFNYLTEAQDREDLRASVLLTREILSQPALSCFRAEELNPGNAVRSDAEIDAWVRQGVETCYHPVGTCRMGRDPTDSVVDAECRVHGIHALRVVDASVMPAIVSGNTNAPTIMIAEKVSDLIRGKPPLPPDPAPVWRHPHWATQQR